MFKKIFKNSIIIFFVLSSFSFPLIADTYHNINGFYGEKAAGLGGAYTAISDDPSGAFYNPAGLAFAYDNSISLSASNLTKTKKTYENTLGPGQNYNRNSQTYIPNFFGIVKEVGKYKVAFSIVNTLNETFNRNDQNVNPIYYPTIRSLRNYNIESYNQIQAGFSLARSINEKFSVGATLYFTSDTANITNTQLLQNANKSYTSSTLSDNRRTLGLLPILGIMYMPNPKLSLGASLRHQFVTAGNRLVNAYSLDSGTNSDSIVFQESTNAASGGSIGNILYRTAPQNSKIPEVTELRLGGAFFPSKRLMVSGDIIYTTGFSRKQDQSEFILGGGSNNRLILNDSDVQELRRYATLNYASGLEYYLTDNFSVRAGIYTNNANSKNVSWMRSYLESANRAISDQETISRSSNGTVTYRPAALRTPVRNEYVDLLGYSIGFSWSTSKASISITYVRESGRGNGQLDATRAINPMSYEGNAFYVIVSSRNN